MNRIDVAVALRRARLVREPAVTRLLRGLRVKEAQREATALEVLKRARRISPKDSPA